MTEVRRQERGRRRIEQILLAAAEVFAERGYENATTNAVAAAAGISPGSLYQYFRNKDELAAALAELYRERLVAFRATFETGSGPADLDVLLNQVLGPLVEFNLANPGFKALFARTDMPAALRAAVAPAHQAIHHQVETLIGTIFPELSPADRSRTTAVAIQTLRGMMPMIVEAPESDRPALVEELRLVLRSYLLARAGR
ncbi:TetR/AcrR family transcriptional regulator [Nocardia carnea]|uniref:TetR/AcrR family transcriptional regulator n=1 Tax=Nocardia carnea TaxID=37328 RepID=UPI0024537833|nr:TetR/AcrR family transcriptional regulator [Nocardia carnea]